MPDIYPQKVKKRFIVLAVLLLVGSFFSFLKIDSGRAIFINFLTKRGQAEIYLRPCLSSPAEERSQCLLETLPWLFKKYGVSNVMAIYKKHISKVGETFSCHEDTHRFGEALYEFSGKDVNRVFSLCSPICHNGCQHGLLGIVAKEKNQPLYEMKELPELCAQNNKGQGGQYLCIHGLGHALLVERQGEILSALFDCDKFKLSVRNIRACWTGVFMENLTNIMGGGGKYLKNNDPLYPCTMNGLDEKYIASCYHQVPAPFGKEFSSCREAPKKWIWACGEGIGIRWASLYSDFPDSIIKICEKGGKDLQIHCLRGAFGYLSLRDNEELREIFCEKLAKDKKASCTSVSSNNNRGGL